MGDAPGIPLQPLSVSGGPGRLGRSHQLGFRDFQKQHDLVAGPTVGVYRQSGDGAAYAEELSGEDKVSDQQTSVCFRMPMIRLVGVADFFMWNPPLVSITREFHFQSPLFFGGFPAARLAQRVGPQGRLTCAIIVNDNTIHSHSIIDRRRVMRQSFGFGRWVTTVGAAVAVTLGTTGTAWGGSCDIDEYVTKAIGIEEPWVENAGYLFTQITNNASPQAITIAPEVEGRFGDRLGMELDLPAYTAQEPLGRAPNAFGPLAVGLKGVGVRTCDLGAGRASLLTGELEGQYWIDPRPSVLPGQGNSVSVQAMWAELWSPWFNQGEAGYTRRIGSGITSGWFVNTSLGRALNTSWATQVEVEVDDQLTLTDGHRGIEGSVMPQISYRPSSKWLVALGEQASLQQGTSQTGWSTWLMIEREFSDSDDSD